MQVVLLEFLSVSINSGLKSLQRAKEWIGLSVHYFTGHLGCYLGSILNNTTSPYKDVYLLHSSTLPTGKNLR